MKAERSRSGTAHSRRIPPPLVGHDIDEAILLGDRVSVMTARPGRLKEQVAVPIPRPRSLDMVMDPGFIAVKRRILELLRHEIRDDEH